jgi:hypothetical protein
MMQELAGDHLTTADAEALSGLLDPHAAGGVLRRPDVFLLGVSTVHTAERS